MTRTGRDHHGAAIVGEHGVVQERHALSIGGHAQVGDPAARFVERGSDRVLDAITVPHDMDDSQAGSVGAPVGLGDAVENFSRRASRDHSGERAHSQVVRLWLVPDRRLMTWEWARSPEWSLEAR